MSDFDAKYLGSLTKELAYALTHEGTNKQGAFAIKTILSQHTHLDLSQIDIADGVGTRYNMITAELMVTLLTDLYHDSNRYPILLAALPQSGVSGTLQDRLKKTVLEKVVYAKTGSMHDISSLSGYLIRKNATPLIFSIMINGVNQPIQVAKALEDQILLAIVTPDNATSIAKPLKKV